MLFQPHCNPIAEALAVEAARLVLQFLPRLLLQAGYAPVAHRLEREQLARASLLAGLAMSQTQTALAHALSYDLTLHEALPHGEACAVWLPMVWELALGRSSSCDAALARVFGVPADAGVQKLRTWLLELGILVRELRHSPEGRARLEREMRSARGSNFIGSENENTSRGL